VKALLIRQPWIDMILDGRKTWELRGSRTAVRGTIALVEAGSGHIVGTARLADVIGPVASTQLRHTTALHGVPSVDLRDPPRYANTYAWVLTTVRRPPRPVPYHHPSGAVIWVNLSRRTSRLVGAARQPRRTRGPGRRPPRTR
jgi:hypothetical protein